MTDDSVHRNTHSCESQIAQTSKRKWRVTRNEKKSDALYAAVPDLVLEFLSVSYFNLSFG
jgi:hypothetical protein